MGAYAVTSERSLIENQNFLVKDTDEEEGVAVALVDVDSVHAWRNEEVKSACASWVKAIFA